MKNIRALLASILILLALSSCKFLKDTEPFTIVMLADTQFYSENFPKFFHEQTSWIRQNVESENIVFVTHVGDVVQNGDSVPDEWKVADQAMSLLDEVVPWGIALGNHDYDLGNPRGRASAYLKYFGPKRFENYCWYGGSSPNSINSYQFFSGGGTKFMVLHMEPDIPDAAIQWAEGIIEQHPGLPTIVSTHIYLDDRSDSRTEEAFYQKDIGHSGECVWDKFIRKHSQIYMVLCGHWGQAGGEWYQVSKNDAGQEVIEILANYQHRENGGDGWLRLIQFSPKENEIQIRTYSPSLEKYETDEDSEFTLPLNFSARFEGR